MITECAKADIHTGTNPHEQQKHAESFFPASLFAVRLTHDPLFVSEQIKSVTWIKEIVCLI
jgi:hypothetical protein